MIYEEILLYHFPEFNKQYYEKVEKNQSVIAHILKGKSAKIVTNKTQSKMFNRLTQKPMMISLCENIIRLKHIKNKN